MAEIKQNQQPVKSASVSGLAGSGTSAPASGSSQSSSSSSGSSIKPPKANFDFKPPKSWLIVGVVAAAAIAVLLVLYFAVFKTKDQPGQDQTATRSVLPQNQAVDSPPPDYKKPEALAPVTAEDDKKVLSQYFASKTEYWKSDFISKVPSEARPALNNYQSAQGEDKVVLARTFYEIVSNPGADDRNPDWINFLIKFREKLEEEVGKKLY